MVSRKLSPLVVTPSSKEATGSMIEAYPTGALTETYDHSRVGIADAAGGASLRDENHTPGAVDDRLLPERQPNDIVDLILSKI